MIPTTAAESFAAPSQGLPVVITNVGLRFTGDVSFEDWRGIAARFGAAVQSAAFCIGDWLVYGEDRWSRQLALPGMESPRGRITLEAYEEAIALTGFDLTTLRTYASVCRSIPLAERFERLTFEHHKILAPLPPPIRLAWGKLVAPQTTERPVSARRLRASVRISPNEPRIVEAEEIVSTPSDGGHDNYIPHLTRLTTVLRQTLPNMSATQRRAVKEDTAQLVEMLRAI